MTKENQELNADVVCQVNGSQRPLLLAPVLATKNNKIFEELKNSTEVINYMGSPTEDYKGAVQILADKAGDGYYALFAGDDLDEAEKQAKDLGLILEGKGFLKPRTLVDINNYLGF